MWLRGRERAQAQAAATEASQAEQMMELLERPREMDATILQSFLDGASWSTSFEEYFIQHCPLFASFEVGSEHTLQQSDIHRKFTATAEQLLDKQLTTMAVTPDQFLQRVMDDMKYAPPDSPAAKAATKVVARLDECADFEQFGTMMRAKFESLQAGADPTPEDDGIVFGDHAQAGGEPAAAGGEGGGEDAEFAREQQRINEARERRKRAREAAIRRAEEAAQELDDAPEPEPEPEPEPQPQPQPEGEGEFEVNGWEAGGDFGKPADAWEAGTVHRGVVSSWETGGGSATGSWGTILKMGKPEIYVHNTALPMDAARRWLRRGEQVEFTVGEHPLTGGTQALDVVGVGADGTAPAPLLCQQMAGFKLSIVLDEEKGGFRLNIANPHF